MSRSCENCVHHVVCRWARAAWLFVTESIGDLPQSDRLPNDLVTRIDEAIARNCSTYRKAK